jgi:FPC/CPF motif-containing protein YcgG
MDVQTTHNLIDAHLDRMNASGDPSSDSDARQQLAATLASVGQINVALEATTSPVESFTSPVDDIVDKLQKWIERLVAKLTAIVKQLGDTATFSLQVGTSVSVTVTVGPFE